MKEINKDPEQSEEQNPWRNTNGGIIKGIRKLKLARLKNESKKNTGENIIQKLLHN